MKRGPLTEIEKARRMALVEAVIAEGGNLTALAARAGMTTQSLHRWLKQNSAGTLARLKGNGRGDGYTPGQVLARLLLIREAKKVRGQLSRLAEAFGVSPSALSMFQKTWAPDGLDAAIADLWPNDDAEPEQRRAA